MVPIKPKWIQIAVTCRKHSRGHQHREQADSGPQGIWVGSEGTAGSTNVSGSELPLAQNVDRRAGIGIVQSRRYRPSVRASDCRYGKGVVVLPTPARFAVSYQRRLHILDGDLTGGGHRFGAGRGKSEFPHTWSDDAIVAAVEAVANDPSLTQTVLAKRRFKVVGLHSGLTILVVADFDTFEIVTGYPL